jgi:hypothetical protein
MAAPAPFLRSVTGSFRPDAEIATLRAYLRQRERLVEYAAGQRADGEARAIQKVAAIDAVVRLSRSRDS